MSKKDAIKKLYSDLDYIDRAEIRKFLEDYETKSIPDRTRINESLNKSFSSGPLATSGSCPICGR